MQPLSNLTILDLTTQLPGPYCSMILGDCGANVIKVEPPAGDPLRHFPPMFASVNRGKKSITLDLKTASDQAILARLIKQADILLEGFRPGVVKRIGADYETACGINPAIIYCSISGFGQDGPYRDRSGHDINYIALGGLLAQADHVNGVPVVPPVLISDLSSGMYAAIAVLTALQYRNQTGKGEYIDLSMTHSAAAWMAPEIARAYAESHAPDRSVLSGLPHYAIFETSDNRYISLGIVYEPHFWQRLCDVLDLIEWKQMDTGERMRQHEEIHARLKDIFKTNTRAFWDRTLQEADVPCGPVYNLDELPSDPQFVHRKILRDMKDSKGTVNRQTMLPFRFSETPFESVSPPPGLNEHEAEILEALEN